MKCEIVKRKFITFLVLTGKTKKNVLFFFKKQTDRRDNFTVNLQKENEMLMPNNGRSKISYYKKNGFEDEEEDG